jgi:hypothetical protein
MSGTADREGARREVADGGGAADEAAVGEGPVGEGAAGEGAAGEYFRTLEEVFIRLRGAPLLLSPADWQTARSWHERGVPVELASRVMEEVFARLRERDPERRVNSLRYCAPAVEAAWREVRDLGAAEGRMEAEPVDVRARLEALIGRLPPELPGREALAAGIAALDRGPDGGAQAVESGLHALEERFVAEAAEALDAGAKEAIDKRVDRALSRAGARVPADELADLSRRLRRDFTRQHLGLPPLTLF